MSGPTIPGYRFVQLLGSGGFADVYLYEQDWPSQKVAIKVVRPDVPLTDREKAMFTSEANAMARLGDHPFNVSVVTAGTTSAGATLRWRHGTATSPQINLLFADGHVDVRAYKPPRISGGPYRTDLLKQNLRPDPRH